MKATVGNSFEIQYAVSRCSLGSILVASSATGVCAILLGASSAELLQNLQERFPGAQLIATVATGLHRRIVEFVDTPSAGFDLQLDARGTEFQRRVWRALREIPIGATASYLDVANRIGSPKSVRAVAGACAANPIAVVIPCHRVVRTDGGLSGYRWGVERKRALLAREKAVRQWAGRTGNGDVAAGVAP
jgi:AraC family transcriptional regulator of adaptative response/methylated-DNA-[protein]-cysteine methyltransferase